MNNWSYLRVVLFVSGYCTRPLLLMEVVVQKCIGGGHDMDSYRLNLFIIKG